MTTTRDSSFGVVPVRINEERIYLFCLVKHADGHWAFPKGHKKAGESQEQAARRELFEETSIKAIDLIPDKEYLEVYSFMKDGVMHEKTVKYFLAITRENEAYPQKDFEKEIVDAQWFAYPELLTHITFAESKKIAQEAYSFLLSGEIKL